MKDGKQGKDDNVGDGQAEVWGKADYKMISLVLNSPTGAYRSYWLKHPIQELVDERKGLTC